METTFALITDKSYIRKAEQTIKDLRTRGCWTGSVVLATIDFILSDEFKQKYNVIEIKFETIDKTTLVENIGKEGFANSDKRELFKLNQWEKLHMFDDYFKQWNRVIYLDAGLRVLDTVEYLLELDYVNKFLAPNDCAPNFQKEKIFKSQLDFGRTEPIERVKRDFGENIFYSQYFLNCMWIYDTNILNICNKTELIQAMNDYPVCRTNEMGIMNLLLHFKYKLWHEFPILTLSGNKYLFEWNETNHAFHTNWTDYCFMKYPYSIEFDV
jgi:lipopolysaccharide biosynthesis glycosyltransferase